jgi:hypothetical protein
VELNGNVWKTIALPYAVTPDTVIEFDFRSTARGEVHGIGFDSDNSYGTADQVGRTFRLYGTQDWGIADFADYDQVSLGSTKHYTIPIGQFFTGSFQYLVFAMDHDVAAPTGNSVFSNVVVYENAPAESLMDFTIARTSDGASRGPTTREPSFANSAVLLPPEAFDNEAGPAIARDALSNAGAGARLLLPRERIDGSRSASQERLPRDVVPPDRRGTLEADYVDAVLADWQFSGGDGTGFAVPPFDDAGLIAVLSQEALFDPPLAPVARRRS